MMDTPRVKRNPAAKIPSQTSGRTSAEKKRPRWLRKRSHSRQTMPPRQRANCDGFSRTGMKPAIRGLAPIARLSWRPLDGFHESVECRLDGGSAGRGSDRGSEPIGQHSTAMQHDDAGLLSDLVDEMRGPENRQGSCPAEAADVVEQKSPAGDVETDRRLVE